MKGNLTGKFQSHHYHSSHPEEENIPGRTENRGGIEFFQFFCFFRPTKSSKGPEAGGEPGIQDILVLSEFCVATGGTGWRSIFSYSWFPTVLTIPDRQLVAPPELTGNTPIMNILHPLKVVFLPARRNKFYFVLFDRSHSFFG